MACSKNKISLAPTSNNKKRRGVAQQSSSSNNDLSEHKDVPVRRNKRARTSRVTASTPQKKHVRGKQGGLKGLLTMPIDIFTEIAYLLNPGDLLALAWSNKFFHDLLLKRSAMHMWRRAYSNIPSLPPCPPDMCEPKYAALVFTKTCTMCGANTMSKLDVSLLARLCKSCRDTELQELNLWHDSIIKPNLVCYAFDTRPTLDEADERRRYTKGAVFAFRRDVEAVQKVQREFRRKRDKQGLVEWENQQSLAIQKKYKHAALLLRYIDNIAKSTSKTNKQLKEERQDAIMNRLKASGWTQEDLTFKGDEAKPWDALVKAPKPLTDRIWANILPKLTRMLEENRERHIAEAKRKRQMARKACVDKFLISMKFTSHPFEFIFQALGVPTPPVPDLNKPPSRWSMTLQFTGPKVANPFPKTITALGWDCLKDIDETEMSVEEVEKKLEERKAEIQAKAVEWRTDVEKQLIERLESSSDGTQLKDELVIAGGTNLAAELPRNTRMLLRADTIFQEEESAYPLGVDEPLYYPCFVSSTNDTLDYDDGPRCMWTKKDTKVINPALFKRNASAGRIVKFMLQNLGMPDASHIELNAMGERFMCARCVDAGPQSWTSLVRHILRETRLSREQNDPAQQPPVRYPITTRVLHEIDGPANSEPLVRLLDKEEAKKLKRAYDRNSFTCDNCYLCEVTTKSWFPGHSIKFIELHLSDKHDVTEPVQGIHYGDLLRGPRRFKEQWYEKWDAHHDALEEDGA
ncbi:valine-tRNA ligase [Ceratobasidium sp. AG-Ba]|nr:valine-tRNA ligase [Ceratobasidium sp. AG-Ba]